MRCSGIACSAVACCVSLERAGHFRVDEPGRHDVGGDRPRTQFAGQRAGHAHQAGLGRRVVGLSGQTGQAGHRTHEDHPAEALLDHVARRPLGHPEHTGEVGVDDLGEVLLAHPHDQHVRGDARVGHQHLDRALVLLDRRERRVDGGAVGHVTLDGKQVLVVRRPGAAVRDGDLVPVGGQPARDGQPDATVSTGHQHRTGDEGRTATGRLAGGIGWIVGHFCHAAPHVRSHEGQLNACTAFLRNRLSWAAAG